MRVISQGSYADLPYERTSLYLDGNYVIARCDGKEYLMGGYSSETKAIQAVEMCRERYLSRMELNGGYDVIHGCYVQPNYWVLPKTFQFPQDDEVKV